MKREFNWRDYDDYSEWLQDILETLTDNNKEKDKEINRLNNIIDELEKYISELLWYDNESDEYRIGIEILNKLNKLKGDNK